MNRLIRKDLETAFGIRMEGSVSVSGGWLNEKWRVSTDKGEILVKQYSHERFNRRKLNEIEQALERQMLLYNRGILCPRVWKAGETIIRRPSEEIDYMVMDFLPGKLVGPDTVNLIQMESLGEACGRMHEAFSRLPVSGVKGYPINPQRIADALNETVRNAEACAADVPEGYRQMIEMLRPLTEQADAGFLARLEQGIAHEDFTPDNMLFDDSGVRAILDFDRNQFSFPLHDVGRSLLSLALQDGRMDWRRVNAFRRGYERHRPLSEQDIRNALRLSWYIEIPWWIQPGCFEKPSPKVWRFMDEMRYLSENMPEFAE